MLYAVIAVVVEMGYLAVGMAKGLKDMKVRGGFQRRYARWVLAAVWIVGVNWVVKNGFLLMGVDLLERLGG